MVKERWGKGEGEGKSEGVKRLKSRLWSSRSWQNPVSPGSSHWGSAGAIYHVIRLPSLKIKPETANGPFSSYGEWDFLCFRIWTSELTPWHPSLNASNNSSTGLIHRNVGCRRAEPLLQLLTGRKRVIIVFHGENKHFIEAYDFSLSRLQDAQPANVKTCIKKKAFVPLYSMNCNPHSSLMRKEM